MTFFIVEIPFFDHFSLNWTVLEDIVSDSTETYFHQTRFHWRELTLDLAGDVSKTPFMYFKLMFPMKYMKNIVILTNDEIVKKEGEARARKVIF